MLCARKPHSAAANGSATTLPIDEKRKKAGAVGAIRLKEGNTNYTLIAELLELGEQVHRKRRQEANKRYRKKQEDLTIILDKDIQDPHEEIKTFEHQRHDASAVFLALNDVWDAAVQYFRLIRHGFQFPSDQVSLVRRSMAPDVVYNTEYGFEAMVQSWSFVQWFGDVEVEMENLNKSAENSIVAKTRTSVTITERALINVFPHLLYSKASDGNSDLANKLLGQRIVMCGSTQFEWDDASERVASVISQSDMLTPMLRLLGYMKDVSRVFEKAFISPDFQWRSTL